MYGYQFAGKTQYASLSCIFSMFKSSNVVHSHTACSILPSLTKAIPALQMQLKAANTSLQP
jgi:hypothetical protein